MSLLPALMWLQTSVAPTVPDGSSEAAMSTEPALSNWFIIYIVLMTTAAFLAVLVLILIMSVKLASISKQLEDISNSTTTFIRVGLDHFKERVGKHVDRRD